MIASVKARYENGVLTPLEPPDLEDGREVTLSIEEIDPPVQGAAAVLQLIDRLHAAVPDRDLTDLPTDMAENYKHYLYGHPKNGDR